MHTSRLCILLFLFTSILKAQFYQGARQTALSNSDVALCNDIFSIFSNPAGLSQINWREAGIFYFPAPFGLKELATASAAYVEPASIGNFAAAATTFGFELYRENTFLFSYSNSINKKYLYGITLKLNSVSIQNYGNDFKLSFDIGTLVYLTENFRWGFFMSNINRASYGEESNQIPVSFNSGFSYDAVNDLTLNLQIEKELTFSPSYRFGIEYFVIDNFSLRGGYSNFPSTFSAGVGIIYSIFQFDYSTLIHQDLGATQQAGIVISFDGAVGRLKKIKDNLDYRGF